MKPFSNENFELKVYLKYIVDKAKDNKYQKCIMDYLAEHNTKELEKFVDKYEFSYVNLKRLETTDEELIPLMREFIDLYEKIEKVVDKDQETDEQKSIIKKKAIILEGNDNNE